MGEEWLKQRIAERKAAERRERIIEDGMDSLWQNLCAALGRNLKEYEKLTSNEIIEWSGPQPAFIWAKVGGADAGATRAMISERNSLEVILNRDRAEVTFKCAESGGTIRIGLNEQEQACFLDAEGNPITVEQAAETILDPFLFP